MDVTVLVTLLLFFSAIKFSQSGEIDRNNNESLLLNALFKDYDKRVRPVRNHHLPVVVGFSVELQKILQVDEKHQVITSNVWRFIRWRDEFLQWNPEHYGNITELSITRGQIWSPDILLYNSASSDNEEQERGSTTRNVITSNGSIADVLPIVVKSTCRIDVTWFPFDEHKCVLIYASWTASSKYLSLQLNKVESPSYDAMDNGEWSLVGLIPKRNVATYSCCPDKQLFTSFVLICVIKRYPS